jgi:hypothetical protein
MAHEGKEFRQLTIRTLLSTASASAVSSPPVSGIVSTTGRRPDPRGRQDHPRAVMCSFSTRPALIDVSTLPPPDEEWGIFSYHMPL